VTFSDGAKYKTTRIVARGLSVDHFLKSYSKNTKNTNGPKFADPRVAAVSPYFKRSMVRDHSRSLKVVPFESLGTVSYSPSIVTMAVSVAVFEIFTVKGWRDLENQIRGRSRSLKMAPFDRPYATIYWSAIVNIALILYHFRVI